MNPALLDLFLLSPTFSPQFLFESGAMQRKYISQVSSDARGDQEGSAVVAEFDRLRERRVPGEQLDSGDRSDVSGEEQVSLMEKDLRADAPWKRIQQATFTRWVNQQMKTPDKIGYAVNNLEKDLSDGLRLICLIECLSGKKLPRHSTSPVFRSQKLENVSVALNFLENEGIKLVSIDSTDIVDGRLKLILALIWALILHYSISQAQWGDEEHQPVEEKVTPKQRLLSWFANRLPVPVRNFTTDWNDGRACGALDNAVAPGLCADWETWDSKDALRNATEAMNLAEKWLGVTQLIRPEDMIDPDIDEQSMMTYLSQFPVAKLKEGAPLWKKNERTDVNEEASLENAYSSGSSVTSSTTTSPTSKATGSSQVTETQEVSEDGTTIITRRETRVSKVVSMSSVIESGEIQQRSSHELRSAISASRCDASKVTVEGNGLHRAYINKAASFKVVADSAGYNMLLVGIYGKILHGHEVQIKHLGNANYQINYVLKEEGEYLLSVKYGDVHIPGSPFVINCTP